MSAPSNVTIDPFAPFDLFDVSLDDTFGAVLLTTFFGLILYGLGLHQTYRYARLYPEDLWFLKLLVVLIGILESLHSAMNMHTCYHYLVSNYFNPFILPKRGVWSLSFLPVCSSAIMIVSQIFFARRVYLIGPKYRYVVALAVFCLAGELAFGVAAAVEANTVTGFDQFYGLTARILALWLISACFGMAAAADALLTGALIIVLRKSRTGFNGTDSLIDTLIIYTINTGLLIGISNCLSLILAASQPKNLVYVGFSIITAKLYGNCFLAVLNSRKRLATRGMDIFDTNSIKMNAIANAARLQELEQWNVPQIDEPESPAVINIHVTTETIGEGLELDSERNESHQEIDDKSYSVSV
ncbi:hypothetical protein OH76DRAFT_1488722 [Lentinus brumalis]|uniref:DUF6534 domain-containing protein n=1 Tax=Lentinus brumalis TaxID=2498619 RepID=A0A371CQ20_9APHY|nr:hypothetical protein OH76DRAFT_1488722 [Polyporus brumalis]